MTTLGFIGVGGMGGPIAANLIDAGNDLVVNDLNRARTEPLVEKGARFAESPRAAAEESDIVLSMLPTSAAARHVALGPEGLAEAGAGSRIWVDLSSIDRGTLIEVSGRLSQTGWRSVDCAANGVEEEAQARTLTILVSGADDDVDIVAPVLEPICAHVVRVGEVGTSKIVKNALAMYTALRFFATAEIAAWLRVGGVSTAHFREILAHSTHASPRLDEEMSKLVSLDFKARKSWMPKDVNFGLDVARELEVPMPFTTMAQQMFAVAQANGCDGYEASAIAYYVYEILHGRGVETP